ncbi:MAG: DSD1 family PLP-dependent enzyme [Alphaproteobacteria bacterium]|nr:MAG: DSD1 family PLP-dependent enzyme [Alphaproteobacteria bacterium]
MNFRKTTKSHNADLIGKPGSRAWLTTPALVLDLDLFEKNLALMKAHAEKAGVALRPHAKTHKSADVARKQIEAGAIGICCAKLSEAEALAAAGISNILLTSPVVTARGFARLIELKRKSAGLLITLDNLEVARRLAAALPNGETPLGVLIDLDVGLHRTGVQPGPQMTELADFIAAEKRFEFRGVQAYAGHVQHIEAFEERRKTSLECMGLLKEACQELSARGMTPEIVSGGGTGTFDIDPELGVLTELQVGSYIFMDAQYFDVTTRQGRQPFEPALQVMTTVISANHAGLATTDAGFKTFASDADAPQIVSGAPQGATYFFYGDEQGGVLIPGGGRLKTGDVLSCIVPHCDPTVNLYDNYHIVRGDTLIDIWPVTARGCSQ